MDKSTDRNPGAPPCPECGAGPEYIEVDTRQGVADLADVRPFQGLARGTVTSVVDVGYRCGKCENVWGFEVLTDGYLQAVELLTGGRDREHQEQAVGIIALWHGRGRDPLGEGA